jgi:hypothetical protein
MLVFGPATINSVHLVAARGFSQIRSRSARMVAANANAAKILHYDSKTCPYGQYASLRS